MRRKITLYIGGRAADLDEQGLVLYNYAFTDLQTPSVVKNSYSKSITLPGTPANAQIFGQYARLDRTTGNGFDAGERTPFSIYDEAGQVLESGYVKLTEIVRKGRIVTGYKVTLYGGLGAFFYALSYGPSGNKLTLWDLDFENTIQLQLPPFAINAQAVRAAWARLRSHDQAAGIETMWDVLNFAPAYNGIPGSKFSADKAVINPSAVGLPASATDGGETYAVRDGLALLNLAQEHDEWAVKDLRSYLQRPVLSMKAFLESVVGYGTQHGYTVDISDIPANTYTNVWKTLPAIPSLGTFKKMTGTGQITYTPDQVEGGYIADLDVANVPAGTTQSVQLQVTPNFKSSTGGIPTSSQKVTGSGGILTYERVLTFVQCVAMNGNIMLAGSPVKVLCNWTSRSGHGLADAVGFKPWVAADYEEPTPFSFSPSLYEDFRTNIELRFNLVASNADYYRLFYHSYIITSRGSGDGEYLVNYRNSSFGGYNGSSFISAEYASLEDYSGSVYYETAEDARSNAMVDPSVLLQSTHTPAEYLVSFCKMHGLVFDYNAAEKKVKILPRDIFFASGEIPAETIDLSGRIDRSKDITIQPLALKSKWYELSQEMVDGAFAQQYQTTYGAKYGAQRINTGYDLDTAVVNLMEGLAFKGAATVLDHSAYWNKITVNQRLLPSVFVDKGNTYTMWTSEGKTREFQVPCPVSGALVDYYNDLHGYDLPNAGKLEFRDADNGALEGEDVLCRYVGAKSYANFCVTDDTAAMLAFNNGTPCWDLTAQAGNTEQVPIFSRYNSLDADARRLATLRTRPATKGGRRSTLTINPVELSLDFGIPRELDYPGVTFDTERGSLYLRYWRAYLSDLLNANTKVMRCRVDLSGLEVSASLLGKFFWYEGSIWVLNKITNYSLTTWDPVDCEFVQVQNTGNYWDGQIL